MYIVCNIVSIQTSGCILYTHTQIEAKLTCFHYTTAEIHLSSFHSMNIMGQRPRIRFSHIHTVTERALESTFPKDSVSLHMDVVAAPLFSLPLGQPFVYTSSRLSHVSMTIQAQG